MPSISNILHRVINGTNNFCCLCLNTIENDNINISLEDEVFVKGMDHSLAMSEIIQYVLGDEILSYVTVFESLCEICTKSAVNSYTFKKICQYNVEVLRNAVDGLSSSFAYANDELQDNTSMFVTLNLRDFTSEQFYDNKRPVSTIQAAIRRYRSLENTKKTKLKLEKSSCEIRNKEENRKKRKGCDIKTSDMLLDKNDHNVFTCRECFKIYPTIWNLRNHYIRVHAPKNFKCPKCPRSYGSPAFLKAHKTESHCPTICVECGKKFNNRQTLRMHELGHNLTLVCPVCGRVYKNKCTYKKHIQLNVCSQKTRASPSEAKFTCDYCQKKYTQKVSLRVHIQYEHGNYKAHVCKWCGKKFWAQSRLKAHIVKHTHEKKFTCTFCNGKFVTKESLLYHTRRHTGEKPYECPQCNNKFLSASRRSEHIKRQHSDARFECDICHSKFNSNSYMHKHKLSHKSDTKVKNEQYALNKVSKIQLKPINNYNIDDFRIVEMQSMLDKDILNVIDKVGDNVVPNSCDGEAYLELSQVQDRILLSDIKVTYNH